MLRPEKLHIFNRSDHPAGGHLLKSALVLILLLLLGSVGNGAWADTYTYHLIGRDGTQVFQYTVNVTNTSTSIALNDNLVSPYAMNYHYYDTESKAVANTAASDFSTYAEMAGTDIYVGYDYNATAGLNLNGGAVYSFRSGDGDGSYYLGFPTLSTNALPNYAYTGDDYQLFFLEGNDPYRIKMRCAAYPGYYVASSWQNGNPVKDDSTGHKGTQVHLYTDMKETSYFAMVKGDKLLNFSYHADNGNYYVMFFDKTKWFYIYGDDTPNAFTSESQIASFCSSAMKGTFAARVRKISLTLNIVSIDHGAGGKVLYSIPVSVDKGTAVSMPVDFQSPLAKNYKFYTLDQFTVTDGQYTLKGDAVETTVFPDADGQTLYVKYEYDADNSITFGSNTLHVDLTGRSTYTINNNTEATKAYLCWGPSRVRLDSSDDSYQISFNNTADPATWNDFYLWTFSGEDPYAMTIRSAMPDARNFFLTPQNGIGGNGSHSWLVPDATEQDIIRTWALLSGNRLVSQPVPGNTSKVVIYRNTGWTYQNDLTAIESQSDILLASPVYTYRVVNKSGSVVLSACVAVPADQSEALSVPADLKSAHIIDDGNHYKYFRTTAEALAYSTAADDAARATAAAAAISRYSDLNGQMQIFVGYHYDPSNLPAGTPELCAQSTVTTTAVRYHVQIGQNTDRYWRASDKNNNNRPNFGLGNNELAAANYQWIFVSDNQDPYDIRIVTPYWPNDQLHDISNSLADGGSDGAFSTGHGMYLGNHVHAGTADKPEINRFYFTQSDIGIVVGAIVKRNKAGQQAYLYNYNNSYALLQRQTRGGDNRQLFAINKLYCYHVVSKSTGQIAVSSYMPATQPLTVPLGIRTPLMTNSQYRFFTTQAAAVAYNADPTDAVASEQGAITTAPTTTTEIYLGYNYENKPDVLDLTGERWYNMKLDNTPGSSSTKYVYTHKTNNTDIDTYSQADKENTLNFMWRITGNDPYYVQIFSGKSGGRLYTSGLRNKDANDSENWRRDVYHYISGTNYNETSVEHFMLLEHMDEQFSIAVVRPGRDEVTQGNRYIGQKEYLWTFGARDASHCSMSNNHETFTYYSDRNSQGYHSKVSFEEITYETTFHIIDNSGREAIKYTGQFPANMPLDFAHIPATIRSPYLIDETLTFYTTASDNGTASDGRTVYALSDAVTTTPSTAGADVYVRYTTDHLSEKPFRLTGARNFNVRINGDNYIYYNSSDITSEDTDAHSSDNTHYWNLFGGDPYAMQIRNVSATVAAGGTAQVVTYSLTSSDVNPLTLGASGPGTYFIAMRNNPEAYYEVMAATGDNAAEVYYNIGLDATNGVKLYRNDVYRQGSAELQMLLSTNELRAVYYIVDKQHKIVIKAEDENVELQVPAAIRSPLVSQYHYYKLADFTVDGDTYVLTDPNQAELDNITSAGEKVGDAYQIYVTYDVSDAINLNGSAGGKMYRLKFHNGTSFYEEDGHDGVKGRTSTAYGTTAVKAMYPYANGEGNFYIHGKEQLDIEMGAAGTTRSRWAWFLEGNDPYHVRIASNQLYNLQYATRSLGQNTCSTVGSSESNLRLYFHTYKPAGYSEIVTGAITQQSYVSLRDYGDAPENTTATEYMILGTTGNYQLITTLPVTGVDNKTLTERYTVSSFESYWKNAPTVLDILAERQYDTSYTKEQRATYAETLNGRDLTAAEKTYLENTFGWHAYDAWGVINSWSVTSSKKYQYAQHLFQTVDMGNVFDLEEMEIDPVLILLDQHGWEVMRKPIPMNPSVAQSKKDQLYAAISPYNSPMVKAYHWWVAGSKIPGYHKYTVSSLVTVEGVPYTSTSLTSLPPYDAVDNGMNRDSKGNTLDYYVTYEVKEEYATSYTGATASAAGEPSAFLLRQGSNYAQTTDGSTITTTTVPATAIADNSAASITDGMLWYLKPNYDIDIEMGYKYEGEEGAVEGAKTRIETEQTYIDTEYYSNGFDPYNIQIESVGQRGKYFTTNATGAALDATASMSSTYAGSMTVTLTAGTATVAGWGHDNVALNITNATFMAVQDANGNMRLMPRFDHGHVVTNLTSLLDQDAAAPANDQEAVQTTILLRPLSYEYIIVDNEGHESIRYQGSLGELSPQIPLHLQSPLAKDFVFYKDLTYQDGIYTEIPAGTDISAKQITSSFAAAGVTGMTNTVYVRYSFNAAGDKYRLLSEGDWHTVLLNDKYMEVTYDNGQATMKFGILPDPVPDAWQCKFIGNATSEQPDPYNVSGYNRQRATSRWNLHYALLQHGDDVALCVARRDYASEAATYRTTADEEKYKYYFLSNTQSDGTASDAGTPDDITDDPIVFYYEPRFTGKATYTEDGVVKTYPAGTFDGTKSQLKFGDVPLHQLTYYVITNDGRLALTAKEPASRVQGEPSLPIAILPPWARSPLLRTEDFSYYMNATANGDGTYTIAPEDRIDLLTGLPSDTVYVRYKYDRETCPFTVKDVYFTDDATPKFTPLDLTGETWYNIVSYSWGTDWLFSYNETADDRINHLDRPAKNAYPNHDGNFDFQSTKPYLWKLGGSDPYAIKIYAATKGETKWVSAEDNTQNGDGYPIFLSNAEGNAIQTFMLLRPPTKENFIRIVATGEIHIYLDNPRWYQNSKYLQWHAEIDESLENPFKSASGENYEFFKAPTVRYYTFHAMNCDDSAHPVNTWTAKLQRNMLAPVNMREDLKRLFAKYETGFGTNAFVDYEEAEGGFYSDATMTAKVRDAETEREDVYPMIADDASYDIYFKYTTLTNAEIAETGAGFQYSSLTDISEDIAKHAVDPNVPLYDAESASGGLKANWFMMNINLNDQHGTANGRYFLRYDPDHADEVRYCTDPIINDQSATTAIMKTIQQWRPTERSPFQEGSWLFAFTGDPYALKIVNMQASTTYDGDGNGSPGDLHYVTAAAADNSLTGRNNVMTLKTEAESTLNLWGLYDIGNAEGGFALNLNGSDFLENTEHVADQLYWYFDNTPRSLCGNALAANTTTNAISLLPYQPLQWIDAVKIHIRKLETGVFNTETRPDGTIKFGADGTYSAEHGRYFAVGDNFSLSEIPYNLKRRFCRYYIVDVDESDAYQQDAADQSQVTLNNVGGDVWLRYEVTKPEYFTTKELALSDTLTNVWFMDFPLANTTSPDACGILGSHAYVSETAVSMDNRSTTRLYNTTNNRLETAPNRLKWFLVGDPYCLQVFSTHELGGRGTKPLQRVSHNGVDNPHGWQFRNDCADLNGTEETYWEMVDPMTDENEDYFALRFLVPADHPIRLYRGNYYYLSPIYSRGGYRNVTTGLDESKDVNLNFYYYNALTSYGGHTDWHQANGLSQAIHLVKPATIYATVHAGTTSGAEITKDELSEYYGVGETITNLPQHLQRQFCTYLTDDDTKSFSYTITRQTNNHFNCAYELVANSPFYASSEALATAASANQVNWYNMQINRYLYYDKERTTPSNGNIGPEGRLETMKGYHWAFIGTPYSFQAVNRRLYEDGAVTARLGTATVGARDGYLVAGAPTGNVNWAFIRKKADNGYMLCYSSPKTTSSNDTSNELTIRNEAATATNGFTYVRNDHYSYDGFINGFCANYTYGLDYTATFRNFNQGGAHVTLTTVRDDRGQTGGDNVANDCFDGFVKIWDTSVTPKRLVYYSGRIELPRYTSFYNGLPFDARRDYCSYPEVLVTEDDITAAKAGAADSKWYGYYDVALTHKMLRLDETDGSGNFKLQDYSKHPTEDDCTIHAYYTFDDQYFSTDTDNLIWVNGKFDWSVYVSTTTTEEVTRPDYDHPIYTYNDDTHLIETVTYPDTTVTVTKKGGSYYTKEGWATSANLDNPGTYSQTLAYGHQLSQNNDNRLKWALVGDPYSFRLMNYMQYLKNTNTYLVGNATGTSPVQFSDLTTGFPQTGAMWTLKLTNDSTAYLALLNETATYNNYTEGTTESAVNTVGSIAQYVTFTRENSSGADIDGTLQYLHLTGGTDIDNTANALDIGNAKAFKLAGLLQSVQQIIYHWNKHATSLRDVEHYPILDYEAKKVGVGNLLSAPSYMKRPFCRYTYRVAKIENVNNLSMNDDETAALQALVGKEVNTALAAFTDMRVTIDVIYTPTADISYATNNATTKWFTFETEETEPALANFTYQRGTLAAATDRTYRYTNDYLWAIEGDPYGFKLHNRYATNNHSGWTEVMATTAAPAANGSLTLNTAADDYRVFEMLEGNYTGQGAFLVHPVAASDWMTNVTYDNDMPGYSANTLVSRYSLGSALYVRNNGGTMSLQSLGSVEAQHLAAANWCLALNKTQLQPYFNRAGYVGGLKPDVARSNQALWTRLQADAPTASALTDAQTLVYTAANLVALDGNGYWRLHGLTTPRYVSGYTHLTEKTAGINLHFHSVPEAERTLTTYGALPAGTYDVTNATRGDIELLPVEYDPSSIFYFQPSTNTATVSTQGLYVTNAATMSDASASLQWMDIGGAVVTLQSNGSAITTGYFAPDATKRYTVGVGSANELTDGAKWCMQPAGDNTDRYHHQMPLRLRMNDGGNSFWYASLVVPFDVKLSSTVDVAFIAHETVSNLVSVSRYNGQGNGQFVPAGTPVIVRAVNVQDGTGGTHYITMNLPSTTPTAAISDNQLSGQYLEQMLANPGSGNKYFVFGLPVSDVTDWSIDASGSILKNASPVLGAQDHSGAVGFYTNTNLYREADESAANWPNHNWYVYHNKVYYIGVASSRSYDYLSVTFDGEPVVEPDGTPVESRHDGCVYDMQGRMVATEQMVKAGVWRRNLKPGVYIIDGRKVVVK